MRMPFFSKCPSPDAEHGPLIGFLSVSIESLESHSIGVEGKEHMRFPYDFDRCVWLEYV